MRRLPVIVSLVAATVSATAAAGSLSPAQAHPARSTPGASKPAASSAMKSVPGVGRVPAACVHRVPAGARIRQTVTATLVQVGSRTTRFDHRRQCATDGSSTASGRLSTDARHHQVSPSSRVVPTTPPADGWQTAAFYYVPAGRVFRRQESDILVPPGPARPGDGQIDFFFPGASPVNSSTILQPVLTYSSARSYDIPTTPTDHGWAVASWWGPDSDGQFYVSAPVTVKAGDRLHGTIIRSCASATATACKWTITSTDVTTGKSTSLVDARDSHAYDWLFAGVEETYGTKGHCADLPQGPVKFTHVRNYFASGAEIVPPSSGYTTVSFHPYCGQHAAQDAAHRTVWSLYNGLARN